MNEAVFELTPEWLGRAFHGSKQHSSSDRPDVRKRRVWVTREKDQTDGLAGAGPRTAQNSTLRSSGLTPQYVEATSSF